MKKARLGVLILFMIIGCSTNNDDISTDPGLIGKWTRSEQITAEDVDQTIEEGEYLYTHQIEFFPDNSFREVTYLVHSENRGEIIGYLSKNEGTYEVTGNRLQRNFGRWYSNQAYSTRFVPEEELIVVHENLNEALNYSFLSRNTTLVFDFDPCPENAFCMDKVEFKREN